MTAPQDNHPLHQKKPAHSQRPPASQPRPRRPLKDRPLLTYVLIAVNVLLFLAGYLSQGADVQLFAGGALDPVRVIADGEIYRLLTAMFLHLGVAHIFFNMYALYVVGSVLEPIFGRLRFMLIYLLGGLAGSVLSLALGDLAAWSVGASGAVFAIITAETLHLHQHRRIYPHAQRQLQHMVFLIVVNLLIGFAPGTRINNWAHIGGMLGGLVLAWRIAPRLDPRRLTALPKSIRDLAKADVNPLSGQLPALFIYALVLVGVLLLAMTLRAA